MKRLTPLTAILALTIISAAQMLAQEIPSQFDLANSLAASQKNSPVQFALANGLAGSREDNPAQFDLADDLAASREGSLEPDSLSQPPKHSLLPPNMSIMEKWLWGENGVLRETGIVSPLSPQERKSELSLRRTMLTTHQIGGFVTLALMGSAVYFGQQVIDGHREYRRNHQYFVTATIISYSATGLLAVFSPPPLIRRDEVSTTTIHKTLAWIHVAGMIITPILGGMIKHRGSSTLESEHIHQISGYITTAVFTASMITVTF